MVLATAGGPLVGVWVTRWIDKSNARIRKREALFETLIRTRGVELSPDYVSAFNMVPLLFTEEAVRAAYSRVMGVLTSGALGASDQERAAEALRQLFAARHDLIRSISHAVKTPLPDGEFERYGYSPEGWSQQNRELQSIRSGLIEVLEGRQPLTVTPAQPPQAPEPPSLRVK